MQESFVHLLICILFPWVQQISTCMDIIYTCWYDFYTHWCDVFTCKNVLYTLSYMFYSHGCNKFLHGRTFLHSLIPLLFPRLRCIYMQEFSVLLLICLLFPWLQCQSLKPLLSQCSQTGFVTVDDFITLYTSSYVFYSHGCNKFLHARKFLP